MPLLQSGGGDLVSSMVGGATTGQQPDMLFMLVALVAFFLLRAYLVQWSYNEIVPKLMTSWTGSAQNFRALAYGEAILLTILASMLFC